MFHDLSMLEEYEMCLIYPYMIILLSCITNAMIQTYTCMEMRQATKMWAN